MRSDVDVYELAMTQLGMDRPPTTSDEFADLYEKVTSQWDLFSEQMDFWTEWYSEIEAVEEARHTPQEWFLGKLAEGHDVRSLTFFLQETMDTDWDTIRGYLAGRPNAVLYNLLPELQDWVDLQTFVRETHAYRPSYGAMRKWVGMKRGFKLASKEAPTGYTVLKMGDMFGGAVVDKHGKPHDFQRESARKAMRTLKVSAA